MTYTTLISADSLHPHLNDHGWIVIDCRFSLADTEAGFSSYRHGHIPNARYAHLDKDLSATVTDLTGRHPLPVFSALANKLGAWGIDNNSQIVVYDDASGAIAGRLWWLLRCLGHVDVAVLDGGYKHWQKLGFPVTTTLPTLKPSVFRAYPGENTGLTALEVQNGLARKALCLIDARTPERYHGEQEPIDPVAGHIPGAVNRPFQLNLDSNGLFLSAQALRTSSTCAAQALPPAIICWQWKWRGWLALNFTLAPGANGSVIKTGRPPEMAVRSAQSVSKRCDQLPQYPNGHMFGLTTCLS
jgi:thiosulfate/3-mercaptopyruvate sulfurtransferase